MEGLSDKVIAERFADFKKEQAKMEQDLPYPGGESAGDAVKRAFPVLERIAKGPEKQVVVVSHGCLIRSLVAHILGIDLAKRGIFGKGMENSSITELTYDPELDQFRLERFNDYAHLEKYPELLRAAWVDAEN